jgi:DNA-binding MarR family transcriptional regulator
MCSEDGQCLTGEQDMTDEFLRQSDALRDLRALEAIEQDSSVSQRELADTLGVAVGVANACVHALVRKGSVRIRGESNRSITYHLTKKGVLHKSRLAMEWTRNTVDFYRQARRDVVDRLRVLADSGERRLVLVGDEALAEIAVIVSAEAGVTVLAVVPDVSGPDGLMGIPVLDLDDALALGPDVVVSCASNRGAELRDRRVQVRELVEFGTADRGPA